MTALLALVTAASLLAPPRTGEEVVKAMYDRYAGKWYRTMTFIQKTTHPDGRVETWYEAARLPGRLRIDIAPLDSGKAIIFRNDSIFQLAGGKVQEARPLIHPLLILGFDIYRDPVNRTVEKLQALKFDLSKVHTSTWQGRPVYVVGADSGDARSPQFWIDQEHLLFVRLLRTSPDGTVNETQFNKYVPLGETWIAPEVLFFSNGKRTTTEEYRDMKADVALEDDLFDTDGFKAAGWITRRP